MKTFLEKLGFILLSVVFIMVLLASTSGGQTTGRPVAGNAVKVGALLPFTGILAEAARTNYDGLEVAFDELGWKVAGKDIKVIKSDDEGNPGTAVTRAKELIEQDKVDFVIGPSPSASILAVRDYIDSKGTPTIVCIGPGVTTKEKFSKYIFRPAYCAGDQIEKVLGDYVFKVMGKRKVVGIVADFAAGHDFFNGFKKTFADLNGGQVVQEIWTPRGTADFAPYLTKVNPKDADVAFAFHIGSSAVSFVKQYAEFGLKTQIPLTGIGIVDGYLLPAEGDAALGIVQIDMYASTVDNPQSRNFVRAFKKKTGGEPDIYAVVGYLQGKIIIETLKAVKGDTSNKLKLVDAIEKVNFDAPVGPFRFDKNHNAIVNAYIFTPQKIGGEITNRVIYTIKDTYQGWMPPK